MSVLFCKIKNYLKENYHIFCILAVFGYAVYVLSHVILSSDDYTYKQVAVCNVPEIIDFMKWHIANYNGRTLIHILIIAFLRYDVGFYIWKILCALSLAGSVVLIGKLTSSNKEEYRIACVASTVLFITIGQIMFNRSIFWLSGSFNYFLPTLYVILVLFMVIKRPDSKLIYFSAFIGGALNEQNGMMTVGIFLMLLADGIYRNKRALRKSVIRFLLALIGFLTVMLSPGTLGRSEKQGEYTAIDFIRNTVTVIRQNILGNRQTLILMMCVTAAVVYWLFRIKNSNRFTKFLSTFLIFSILVLTVFNIVLMIFWTWNEKNGNAFELNPMFNYAVMALWLLYAVVFIVSIMYSTFYVYIRENSVIPFVSVVLAIGSNIMMVISKKLVYRYSTAGIFMFIIFVVYTLIYCINKSFVKNGKQMNNKRLVRTVKVSALIFCIACATVQANFATDYLNIANVRNLKPLDAEEMKAFEYELSDSTYYKSFSWMNLHDITDFSHYQADDSAYRDTNRTNTK